MDLLRNSRPSSLTTLPGFPNVQNTLFVKASLMSSARACRSGTATTYLLNVSKIVRIFVNPSLDFHESSAAAVLGETMSIAIFSQGAVAFDTLEGAPLCMLRGVLRFLQAKHAVTHRLQSTYMLCHQKNILIAAYVRL
jgi:hypothetical protein